jgi:hypothetical protein
MPILCFLCYLLLVRPSFFFIRVLTATNLPVGALLGGGCESFVAARKFERVAVQRNAEMRTFSAFLCVLCG